MLLSLLDLVLILLSSREFLLAGIHPYATEPFRSCIQRLDFLRSEITFCLSVEGFTAVGISSYTILCNLRYNRKIEDGV